MANIVLLCTILVAIYIRSIKCENRETQTTKEWIFQFDLENEKHWDNYDVSQDKSQLSKLIGSSNGCTSRIPIIFKKLCVNWNHNNGYTLQFKSSNNMNIDPNYDDMLWYYGDHNTAKKAEQMAKAKYVDLEDKQLREISHNIDPSITLRRRLTTKLGTKKCHWYHDAKACAHLDASNKNLMTVSIGVNEDNNDAAAQYNDYDDYYNNENEYEYEYEYYDDDDDDDDEYYDDDSEYYDEDYNEYDVNEIYNEFMQEQALYNQYMQNLNNLYSQNYFQQQQQQLSAAQELYNEYYYNNLGDSDEKIRAEGEEGEGEGEDAQFGISENSIMQKAEEEARMHVEKKMEKKLEGKLESEMMKKLNGGFDGMMHRKHKSNYGGDMDEEHGGPPQEEDDIEDDENENAPHDSLSAEP